MIRICLPDLTGRIDLDTVSAVDETFTGGKQADLLLTRYSMRRIDPYSRVFRTPDASFSNLLRRHRPTMST